MSIVSDLMEFLWCRGIGQKGLDYYESLLPKPITMPDKMMKIPRLFHQTNYTKFIKAEIANSISEMLTVNSDWKHQLYDDLDIEEFILTHYGEKILSYYHRIDSFYGAARADLFRYLLIYQLGGVYLDIKTTVKGRLDELLKEDDEFLISFWDNEPGDLHEGQTFVSELNHISRGEYVQWCIISRPRHPLMYSVIIRVLQMIDSYNPYKVGMGFMGTIRTTGPAPYTLAIEEAIKRGEKGYRWVSFLKDLNIQYSIYEGKGKSLEHKKVLRSDYHLGLRPVVKHQNKVIEKITVWYMKLLALYRKGWIDRKCQ